MRITKGYSQESILKQVSSAAQPSALFSSEAVLMDVDMVQNKGGKNNQKGKKWNLKERAGGTICQHLDVVEEKAVEISKERESPKARKVVVNRMENTKES